jgi:hypothetical protein
VFYPIGVWRQKAEGERGRIMEIERKRRKNGER